MNDEVIITCRGKVCELYKDTYVKKGEKPKYSAEMELSDIVVKETESKKDKAAMVASILNMQPKGEKKG